MHLSKPAEIVGKIVDLLAPLAPDERVRVIRASQMLLGDAPVPEASGRTDGRQDVDDTRDRSEGSGFNNKADAWQKQNSVTDDQLAQVFHSADGKTDVIAGEIPGKNKAEQTLNVYVLAGIAKLLSEDDPKFSDDEARALCTSAGCYDSRNHTRIMRNKGNWFTGTKESGWTLTAPGLKQASVVIKSLAAE